MTRWHLENERIYITATFSKLTLPRQFHYRDKIPYITATIFLYITATYLTIPLPLASYIHVKLLLISCMYLLPPAHHEEMEVGWLCSNRPPNTINSSKSVYHLLLHPLSMHLHTFEFLKTLSFLNLKPSIIIPGFPWLVVNFPWLNHQAECEWGFYESYLYLRSGQCVYFDHSDY